MAALVVVSVDEFGLEGAEKRFGGGVVPAHPGPSHRLCDAICPAELGGGPRGVLGGFNWWSQHLVMKEVCGECCGASGGDSCDARPDAVAWSAVESAA